MRLLYNCSIYLYRIAISVAQFFIPKAKKWVAGRKNWRAEMSALKAEKNILWIHVASYGEFEQGKPVIEQLKTKFPAYKVLMTFFSPSGYESKKDYEKVDFVHYLPLDTKRNARDFIDLIEPKIAIFVRYEFWFNYLYACHDREIPVIYFSSSFRSNQLYFKSYGTWFLQALKQCELFLVRDKKSAEVLQEVGIHHSEVLGDTRFDSVMKNAQLNTTLPIIESFKEDKKLVVFGSTWGSDEVLIIKWLNEFENLPFKVIIAPHEIDPNSVNDFQEQVKHKLVKYSDPQHENAAVLWIDSIGLLKNIYRYADLSYVGGGFGAGIHNLLEPAVFGKAVVFGPKHHKFQEAFELKALGLGHVIQKPNEFSPTINALLKVSNDNGKEKIGIEKVDLYFKQHEGASEKILNRIADRMK